MSRWILGALALLVVGVNGHVQAQEWCITPEQRLSMVEAFMDNAGLPIDVFIASESLVVDLLAFYNEMPPPTNLPADAAVVGRSVTENVAIVLFFENGCQAGDRGFTMPLWQFDEMFDRGGVEPSSFIPGRNA